MAKVKLSKLQLAYREFFRAKMEEFSEKLGYSIKSPVNLKTDKDRKDFWNSIKKEWPAAKKKISEGVLRQEIRGMIAEILDEQILNEGLLSKVNSEIKKYKKQLENRWKTKGAYENFGQKEVRKLEDKYIDSSKYTDEMNQVRDAIKSFDDWAANYDG